MDRTDHILIVDDDAEIRALLGRYLEKSGLRATAVADGRAMWQALDAAPFDLIVLDLMLPGDDGLTLCRNLRARSDIPIIMLTARGDETDRIVGLELGADDYLPKPFNPRELLARIQAVLRRSEPEPPKDKKISAGPITVHPERRLATLNGTPLELTTTEFEILRTLVANAGRVIPRERLMELARGADFAAFERAVDVHVSHLRKKLGDDPKSPTLLKTVRGIGYTVPRDE